MLPSCFSKPEKRKELFMNEILHLLPVLFMAISMNIITGTYYNIGTKKLPFSFKTLFSGILKATIIAGIFLGTGYCFETTDLSSIGVTPVFILTSAITLYVGKTLVSLGKILGIEVKLK